MATAKSEVFPIEDVTPTPTVMPAEGSALDGQFDKLESVINTPQYTETNQWTPAPVAASPAAQQAGIPLNNTPIPVLPVLHPETGAVITSPEEFPAFQMEYADVHPQNYQEQAVVVPQPAGVVTGEVIPPVVSKDTPMNFVPGMLHAVPQSDAPANLLPGQLVNPARDGNVLNLAPTQLVSVPLDYVAGQPIPVAGGVVETVNPVTGQQTVEETPMVVETPVVVKLSKYKEEKKHHGV